MHLHVCMQNFDLNIEPYLQEYLTVTNQLNLDDEDCDEETTVQNFATAALKIQNSVGM